MSFIYTPAKLKIGQGAIDFQNGGDTFRTALLMTNTTADTEEDTEFVAGFTTLDECDGSNYARQTLANQAITQDAANDRAEFDADDVVFTSLGAGTRSNAGALLYKFVTNDAASPNIAWIDTGGFPFNGTGANNTIQWNAEGILQLT